MAVATTFIFMMLAKSVDYGSANEFLEKSADSVFSDELKAAGGHDQIFIEQRIGNMEKALRPLVQSMSKNEHGKLGQAAVNYVLQRFFIERHAWALKGIIPDGTGHAAWNKTSPTILFGGQFPEYQAMYEKRIRKVGLDLHEVAKFAAVLERLVFKEAIARLTIAYQALNLSPDLEIEKSQALEALDTYMAVYILGFTLNANKTSVTALQAHELRKMVPKVYPTWPDTQNFIRDVQESVVPKRNYFLFSDVVSVIQEAGDRYGRWQDRECRDLKELLLAVEDTGAGGAGRVRLADFYNLALNEGKWQFTESVKYLRQLGALDESDAKTPRVMIANYLQSPANCVASSSYYSVCCIDECEPLLSELERKLARPEAQPEEIATMVAHLQSSTRNDRKYLSPWLLERLRDVAAVHGGIVPLHGRLFSQWMHFAYPNECAYPHVSGTTDPQTLEEIAQSQETISESLATEDEMKQFLKAAPARTSKILNASAHEVLTLLSMDEELVVWRPEAEAFSIKSLSMLLGGSASLGAVGLAVIGLVKRFILDRSHSFVSPEQPFLCV